MYSLKLVRRCGSNEYLNKYFGIETGKIITTIFLLSGASIRIEQFVPASLILIDYLLLVVLLPIIRAMQVYGKQKSRTDQHSRSLARAVSCLGDNFFSVPLLCRLPGKTGLLSRM